MMQNPVYLIAIVAAATGLCFLWDLGIRVFLLDCLRERLFQLRFSLFELGLSGELSFDSETYRNMETLFNGLLRYGHRFSVTTYILSAKHQANARKEKDYVDVARQIDLSISRQEPAQREKLQKILVDIHQALILYMTFSSLLVLAAMAVYVMLNMLGIASVDDRKVTAVIEREAYWAETRQRRLAIG